MKRETRNAKRETKFNVAVITGTRAEFGIWTPVLHAIQRSKSLRLQLIVTGMHLQKQFGHTIDDIQKSNIPIAATVPMYKPHDTPADSLARATAGLAKTFRQLQTQLVFVLGDRLEMLAAANAALAERLPLAHLHGGESAPAVWDEQIRHAITKIAHLHFCATKLAAARIRQMGEDPKQIHIVGAPALDAINAFIQSHAGFPVPHNPLEPMIMLLHPSSPDESEEERHTEMLISAVSGHPCALIGPNNDPGHKGILRAYSRRRLTRAIAMSLSQKYFWQCLTQASVLIGNSSSGIIEAASFALPVINLGDRQKGRERNPNVIDVPWSAGEAGIRRAIHFATTNKPFLKKVAQRQNLYGDGHASERIVKILGKIAHTGLPTAKQFHDAQ